MIRDPIHRFLSEFRHVQRGATWKASRHICNGQYATPEVNVFPANVLFVQVSFKKRSLYGVDTIKFNNLQELGKCYSGRSWTGVSLNEFLSCSHNLAFNRQTRMLSDLNLVGCYNK